MCARWQAYMPRLSLERCSGGVSRMWGVDQTDQVSKLAGRAKPHEPKKSYLYKEKAQLNTPCLAERLGLGSFGCVHTPLLSAGPGLVPGSPPPLLREWPASNGGGESLVLSLGGWPRGKTIANFLVSRLHVVSPKQTKRPHRPCGKIGLWSPHRRRQ